MPLTARDIMTPAVVSLERGSSARDAAILMTHRGVGCLIVTVGGYPVGIITETDLVRVLSQDQSASQVPIEQIMSSPLFSTTPEADVIAIANTMTANRIKKMPVLERQHIIGIITQTDVVKFALRTISSLQTEFTEGKIGANEFAARSKEIFVSVPHIPAAAKEWHMKCNSCHNQFLAEETNGKLNRESCPKCNGEISYDLTPPL
mgnify:CR=1 FL=1